MQSLLALWLFQWGPLLVQIGTVKCHGADFEFCWGGDLSPKNKSHIWSDSKNKKYLYSLNLKEDMNGSLIFYSAEDSRI